jgi:hypothetical protein
VAIGALIWITLMAIELALQLTGAAAQPRQPGGPLLVPALIFVLPFAEVAVAALIVSMIVHEDPLVDTHAFWLTRPIPRAQLFLAKLTAVAITIFAPALAALFVLMAWYHVPPLYMMRAGFEVVLWLSLPLLILTLAATFTSSLVPFIALLVCAFIGGIVVVGLLQNYERPLVFVYQPPLPGFVDPTQAVTVVAIAIAGFCVSLYLFYRRRNLRVALVCVALVVVAATQVGRHWPGFSFFAPLGEPTGAWTNPANTRLRLLDLRMQVRAYSPRELYSVAAPLVLDGLPDGYTATPYTLAGQMTRLDGSVLKSRRAWPVQVQVKGDYQPSLTLPFSNDLVNAGPTSWEAWPVLLQLRQGHQAELVNDGSVGGGPMFYRGKYNGTFYYQIARNEPVATLRLDRPGASYADGPRAITIVETQDLQSECRVTAEVTSTELALAGPREPTSSYYFADRQTGARLRGTRESIWPGMLGPLRIGLSPGRRIFAIARIRWTVVNLRGDGEGDDQASACADTDLVFVRTTPAGSLTRSIELSHLRIEPSEDQFFH